MVVKNNISHFEFLPKPRWVLAQEHSSKQMKSSWTAPSPLAVVHQTWDPSPQGLIHRRLSIDAQMLLESTADCRGAGSWR